MSQRSIERFKALILILMAIFFAEKLVSGKLYFYIGPRFGWLSALAVALFIILAGSYNMVGQQGTESEHEHHDHGHEKTSAWSLLIVSLPLILGTLIPARPLGASAVSSRGIATDLAPEGETSDRTLTIVPAERNILDWVRVISTSPDPAALAGEEADVVGFVYRDARFASDQFMVARFTITCCVADATAIGLVVQSPEASRYADDSWVRVKGTFAKGTLDGQPIPLIVADEITPVQPPEQPYLYP
ncbi:MAG TPA: TIGR03943 family protein [Chloroflexi bacterium]|nr:TIGR03943 family protein [Chloroflexota bacterium]